jgi:hypothetical protein
MNSFIKGILLLLLSAGISQRLRATEPIDLLALVDTNNAATAVATLTLTTSNLHMIVDVPSGSRQMIIMCVSNSVLLPNSAWVYRVLAIPGPPLLTNFPSLPPLPILTNQPPRTNLPIRLPLRTNTTIMPILPISPVRAQPAYPSFLAQSVVPNVSTNIIWPISMPVGGVGDVGGVGNIFLSVLPPRITNEIALTADQVGYFRDGFGVMQFVKTNGLTLTAFIRQVDSDADGVPDASDHCLDTAIGSVVDANGCSIDQLAPCEGNWRNHGEFVIAFRAACGWFLRSGLINSHQARELNSLAAQSDCGK